MFSPSDYYSFLPVIVISGFLADTVISGFLAKIVIPGIRAVILILANPAATRNRSSTSSGVRNCMYAVPVNSFSNPSVTVSFVTNCAWAVPPKPLAIFRSIEEVEVIKLA